MKKVTVLFTPCYKTKYREYVSVDTALYICSIISDTYISEAVEFSGFSDELRFKLKKSDLVFNICYGYSDEKKEISQDEVVKWMDENEILHSAPKYLPHKLCMDKRAYPLILSENLNSPKEIPELTVERVVKKPRFGACGRDIEIFESLEEVKSYDPEKFIFQEYIPGREYTSLFSSEKNFPSLYVGTAEKVCFSEKNIMPLRYVYDVEITKEIMIANEAILSTNYDNSIFGITRTDFKITREGKIYLLDINAMPNIDRSGFAAKIIHASGNSYEKIIKDTIEYFI